MNERLKQENRIASEWLLHMPDRRKELQQRREDIEGRSPSSSIAQGFGGDTGSVSDKTGQAASQLSELAYKESWVKLIERIEAGLPEARKVILNVRRECRHGKYSNSASQYGYAWADRTQYYYSEHMYNNDEIKEDDEIVHKSTLYRWWKEMVEIVVRDAIREGLL